MVDFLEQAIDQCEEYDISCEEKDCWSCDVAQELAELLEDEMIKEHMEELERQHENDPEYQKYLSIPTECLWGCIHCPLRGTEECLSKEEVNNESDRKTEKNS